MRNKKKLILGILAVSLVAALVVGGTLMLWTSKTPTARNVVMMDSCKIELQEAGGQLFRAPWKTGQYAPVSGPGKMYTRHDYLTVGDPINAEDGIKRFADETFEGFDWMAGDGRPGDRLSKAPRVAVKGSIPVYIKMKATLSFEIRPEDLPGMWQDLLKIFPQTNLSTYFDSATSTITPAGKDYLADLISKNLLSPHQGFFDDVLIGVSPYWALDPSANVDTDFRMNGNNYAFYAAYDFYYVDPATCTWGNSPTNYFVTSGNLLAVDPEDETEDMFQYIGIPLSMPNYFQNFIFDVELTAYAVQADNYNGQSLIYPSQWSTIFPTDDASYDIWGLKDTSSYPPAIPY